MADHPKVLFTIDSLKMGGAERITATLLPYFDRIQPAICTLYDHESPLVDRVQDVPFYPAGGRKLLDTAAFRRFLKIVRDVKPDVIHAQLQHATIYSAVAGRLYGIPVVHTRHVMFDPYMDIFKSSLHVRLERLATQLGVQRVIYVSRAALESHRKDMRYPEDQKLVIYNGIDLDRFTVSKPRDVLLKQLDLPADRMIAVMVGVMRLGKGHDVAIEAARLLPDVLFVLVGDGDDAAQLHQQAAGLENVRFLGNRSDIPDILVAGDVFILPSDSEALPTVLIEAGAAGLPIIASDVGGVSEIVQEGINGLLIPPRDPAALAERLSRFKGDPARMQAMGAEGRRLAQERFAIQRQADELTELYLSLIRKG